MCLKSSEARVISFSWLRKKTGDVNSMSPYEKVKPFQHMFLMIYIVWQWKGKFSHGIYGIILSHLSSVYFTLSHCSENYNEMEAPNVRASDSSSMGHCSCYIHFSLWKSTKLIDSPHVHLSDIFKEEMINSLTRYIEIHTTHWKNHLNFFFFFKIRIYVELLKTFWWVLLRLF